MITGLEHGGGLDQAELLFGRPAAGWLDLSTGINPWPYPLPVFPTDCWQRLPGSAALARLNAVAAGFYRVPDPDCLVAAAGSQALIQLLPRLLPPGPVAVVGPTYGEHVRCWRLAGHDAAEVAGLPDDGGHYRYVVVVNPNNPDGRTRQPADLVALARRMAAVDGLLVVDEAFGETAPELSVAPATGQGGLVVIRSFGKFFGLAGLRLGFAAAAPALVAALAGSLGPWAVSGPAHVVAIQALADPAWIAETRRRLTAAAAELDRVLTQAGLGVVGGTPLFRLIESADAGEIYDRCGRAGILLRRFSARPSWLRLGLPPDRGGLERLAACLGPVRETA